MRPTLKHLREIQIRNDDAGPRPVIVVSNEARAALRAFMVKHEIFLPILAQRELAEEFTFEPLGLLRATAVAQGG